MASVIPATTHKAAHKVSQEADLSQSFWQRAAELGALVTFLASNQAGYITGTVTRVDGGASPSVY